MVHLGGVGEGAVPLQGREVLGGAGLVGELQEFLFGGGVDLRDG